MKTDHDLIVNANLIGEGLCFLVPTIWWQNLLKNNKKIKSFRQLKIQESTPIDFLFQLNIINPQSRPTKNDFDDLFRQAQLDYKLIKQQLKEAEYTHNDENQLKRTKIPCQWLQQSHIQFQQNCNLLLFCPKVQQEMIEMYEFNDSSWQFLSSNAYKLIYDRIFQEWKDNISRCMVGVPCLLNNMNVNKKIEFNERSNFQIFMKHYTGHSFAFKGYIDHTFTLNQIIKILFQSMILSTQNNIYLNYDTMNMVIKIGNTPHIIAYKFYNDQRNSQLNWIDFSEIQNKPIYSLESNRIVIFAYGDPIPQTPEKMDEMLNQIDDASIQQLQKTHKKVKRDFTPYLPNEQKMKRAEVRDIFIGQSSAFRPVNPVETIDVHSSTQEQTPFEETNGQRNVIIIQNNHFHHPQINRIPYPLWKEQLSIQKLLKLGQVRFTIPKILKPYSDPAMIILKDQGKKIVLPKECNQLYLNEFGQLMQKQIYQPIIELEEKPPSETISEQLELLALQIMGIKIKDTFQQAEKIQQVDMAKDSSQYEGVTCKNQFMDQFDCEESRQF